MNKMSTVSEVLNALREQGYTVDFNLKDNCLVCHGNSLQIHPEEFVVDKHYRFEGESDPGDEAIVYAISSTKHNIKGILVNGYGISSDPITDKLISALKENVSNGNSQQIAEGANHSSPQRSSAERLLDAELIQIDLRRAEQQIKTDPAWINTDRNTITLFKSESLRIVLIALHEGAELKAHKAPGMITVQVMEGKISFNTERQKAELEKGEMLVLHDSITHSVKAYKESVFLLTLTITG